MKILVVNAGSSSLKYQLIDMENHEVLAKGLCERLGMDGLFTYKVKGKTIFNKEAITMKTHTDAIKQVIKALTAKENGAVASLNDIDAVGHRIVHGGENFTSSVLVTDAVVKEIEGLTPLAPLHQPGHVQGIKACLKAMPGKPNVVVFDTVFHSTMPDYAYRYAIPKQAYTDWKIRKYGFHGSSHQFISGQLEKMVGKKGKFIICHIGNGSSVSAVKNGKCQDTSMGFTPLEGLMMGTRSGDIDPSVVPFIMEKTGKSVEDVLQYLNKESGLLGVSCVSGDIRDVEEHEEQTDDIRLALQMYAYRIKKYIGSYMAALNGADAIAFTAGVGENDAWMREQVLTGLENLGVKLDKKKNLSLPRGATGKISAWNSKVKVYVIPTDEEGLIAQETMQVVLKNK